MTSATTIKRRIRSLIDRPWLRYESPLSESGDSFPQKCEKEVQESGGHHNEPEQKDLLSDLPETWLAHLTTISSCTRCRSAHGPYNCSAFMFILAHRDA